MRRPILFVLISAIIILFGTGSATPVAAGGNDDNSADSRYEVDWQAFSFRSIGPALTSGRVSDFAVNPEDHSEFYVASASGGVWKTTDGGTTFEPVFDSEGSYSIGHVAMDPKNHNVVWVGTGENNNQRSVSYGDGLYKTIDGGKSWKKMGLENSEHIGMIEIHPENSDIVYVAAYGPLWNAGEDRGLYKTTDGGETWERVLHVDEHTGINEVHMDPRDPKTLYATSHQRRRRTWTYIGGGPGSAVYKSTDGGENWRKIMKGLPNGNHIGRIGMDISPANPDVLYAIVDASEGEGFYRSTDRGESWTKRSDYSTSSNYYQEIFADPQDVDRVYSMNTFGQVTVDGGKSWNSMGTKNRHVDDHALWINKDRPENMLIASDGGIYETENRGETWRYFSNLPITQFYKVAVDSAKPFYNIYGGTQDNFTLGGPSRTVDPIGISNAEWQVTKRGDGFEPQVDPKNPNIVYAQSQYGVLARFDKQSGELMSIQPQPPEGEHAYTWNWNSPLEVSPHDHKTLYFAADKVFKSTDRGQSWTEISGDMTRQIDRNKLEVMGRIWPMDAVQKNQSTSKYGNVVSLTESPLQQGLLFAGTDDGLIHITQNDGQDWRTIKEFPGVPDRTYVSDIYASRHDPKTLFAAFDNHKSGDFKPYILKSTNLGRSWTKISGDLPERGQVWTVVQDYKDPNLLFAGTDFSFFVSLDGGEHWKKLDNGLPTIAVRDIAIQKREDDIVLGTFGRGFYVLDDYAPLRKFTKQVKEQPAHLFPVPDARQYLTYSRIGASASSGYYDPKGAQGDTWYYGENPEYGAKITYYLEESIKTIEEQREEREKKKFKDGEPVYYPEYEELKKERDEKPPYLIFTIKDQSGKVVRELRQPAKKGLRRVHWDLRFPDVARVNKGDADPKKTSDEGIMVAPGSYTVEMSKSVNGKETKLTDPVSFEVETLNNLTLPPGNPAQVTEFQHQLMDLSRALNGAYRTVSELEDKIEYYLAAVKVVNDPQAKALRSEIYKMQDSLHAVEKKLRGDRIKRDLDMDRQPSIGDRINEAVYGNLGTVSTPTETQRRLAEIGRKQLKPLLNELRVLSNQTAKRIEQRLDELNAPWTPGRLPDFE
mgnify:CR=1 FL=1